MNFVPSEVKHDIENIISPPEELPLLKNSPSKGGVEPPGELIAEIR